MGEASNDRITTLEAEVHLAKAREAALSSKFDDLERMMEKLKALTDDLLILINNLRSDVQARSTIFDAHTHKVAEHTHNP